MIQTELAAAIYAALRAAGMSLPFPSARFACCAMIRQGGRITVSGTRARETDKEPG